MCRSSPDCRGLLVPNLRETFDVVREPMHSVKDMKLLVQDVDVPILKKNPKGFLMDVLVDTQNG